jgi:hypothetical protein
MGAHDSKDERHLKGAGEKIRKEVLPVLGKIYDDHGPATVLALALMAADIWLESGFATDEWREIIDIYDLEREALRAR